MHTEDRRHPVGDLAAVTLEIEASRKDIEDPGRDDLAASVDDAPAFELSAGHDDDLTGANADLGPAIGSRLGVEDAAAADHGVERRGPRRRLREREEKQEVGRERGRNASIRRVRPHPFFMMPILFASCAGGIRLVDVEVPRPVPPSSCLVIGFLGGRDAWDDASKGVRQLALELRSQGIFAETFENRRRDVALEMTSQALDRNGDGVVADAEARSSHLVVYGQSFGGAAVVKFARELEALAVPIELTVQVDSVGRDDAVLPPNVRAAANLYQTNGWFLEGEHPVRAEDPAATRILGNWRFDYSKPPGSEISLEDVPWWKLAFRIAHARMDRDPAVWVLVRELIETACAGRGRDGVKIARDVPTLELGSPRPSATRSPRPSATRSG